MKTKITILLAIILVALFQPTFAQEYSGIRKLKAVQVAFKNFVEEPPMWSDWQDCNILVVINFDNDKINIYSILEQEYNVITNTKEKKDDQGGRVLYFDAVDEEGIKCTIKLRTDNNDRLQIYIEYTDVSWVYTLKAN